MSAFRAALRLARALGTGARRRYVLEVLNALNGVHPRQCNLCGASGLFEAAGHPPRYDARCPHCQSLDRHRLIGLLLTARPELGRGSVVHFAPEPPVGRLLAARAKRYWTADLLREPCDLKLDIARMDLPDASVDLFVLNHVLEHVACDAAALAELYRCLTPDGAALISVPLIEGWSTSYEDPAIAASPGPGLRTLHFGQSDHLRLYGADFPQRIGDAGFRVEAFTANGAETVRFALVPGEKIFVATKP